MKNRYFVVFLPFIFLMISCVDSKKKKDGVSVRSETFHTVTIDKNYSIGIPKFMTATTGLNEEASLQYQSLLNEAYLLIIDEPKSGFKEVYRGLGQYDDNLSLLQNYRQARLQILSRTTKVGSKSNPEPLNINGLNAESLEIDAKLEGVDNEISYFITFVEGSDQVYMIMAWTLKDKKKEHKKTFKTIAESFKLID
ncbi:MAG: hypothetical protein GYB37_11615 [Algicola sp.]|nr:hypothetical protein [Algicola sp.]